MLNRKKLKKTEELKTTCPNCKAKIDLDKKECYQCGLIFNKKNDFNPIKLEFNNLSNEQISKIKKLNKDLENKNFTKKEKIKTLLKCKKEGLLDLASHYLKDEKDKNFIKNLTLINFLKDKNIKKISPVLLISIIFVLMLFLLTIILNLYI
jgi:hypothetical protein